MSEPAAVAPKIRWGWTVLVVAAIVLILAGGWWWIRGRETSREIAPGERMTSAPQGAVVRGFPKEFLLEKGATITKSYVLEYSAAGVSQSVVSYTSGKNIKDNILAFRVYLLGEDWTLLREGNSAELPATAIYAAKGESQLNITFQPLPEDKTQVTVSYLVKG